MPQELTPAIEPALLLDAEVALWMSGGRFRSGRTIANLIASGALAPTGSVINSAWATPYVASDNISTAIPHDDTIPQVGEGTQILTVAITPKSTTNKLRVRFRGHAAGNGLINVASAMFVNGAANAVQTVSETVGANQYIAALTMEYEFTPASVSAQTISIRAGPSSGTMRFNGNASGRFFGGTFAATLVVEEIKA